MFREGERQFRECVSCGFSDEIRLSPGAREPDTRVNRTPEQREAEERPVKLVDPKSDSD